MPSIVSRRRRRRKRASTIRASVPFMTTARTPTRGDDMDLFEIDETRRMSREDAAARLHALADALARNNSVEFERDGRRITVRVPDEVDLKIEVEIGEENELEIELTW
jgi:amphi-Trp domain-containing protein